MNIEEIKKEFFNYCCDLNLMFRDKKVDNKETVISIVNSNLTVWTSEFHNTIENEMLYSKSISELCSSYGKYVLSCNSYEDYYRLAKILFRIISYDIKIFEGIFIYYYDIVFYTKNTSVKKYFKNNESLFEFYKTKDNVIFEQLIKMTKTVLSKDKYQSDRFRAISVLIN